MPRTTLVLIATMTWVVSSTTAQVPPVFTGRPVVEIVESGYDRSAKDISPRVGRHRECVISENAGRYYWISRENTEVTRHEDGAFITFVATDGSGYVRVIAPGMKSAVALTNETAAMFDYTEHYVRGLETVTYFGKRIS
jgi:hypothetical protein